MPSKYKTINGVKCEADLLVLGEKLTHDDELSIEGARSIWEEALDGNKITDAERNAIQHIMKNSSHGLTNEAKAFFRYWLNEDTVSNLRGAGCVTIDGVHCDEAMVKVADHFQGRKRGPLGIRAAEAIWFSALDGRGVTHREKATIELILHKYNFDGPAKGFLESKRFWLTTAADALAAGEVCDDEAAPAAPAPDAIILRRADAIGLELSLLTPPNSPSADREVANAAPSCSTEDQSASSRSLIHMVPLFAPGTSVCLHGLAADSLNHLSGTCEEFDDSKKRWMVRLSTGEVKAVRPHNLLGPGSHVRLHSLADGAFNDLQGTCEGFDDVKQRWAVRLGSGEVKAFKPENVKVEVRAEKRPGEESAEPPAKRNCNRPKIQLAKLRDIFDRCDINQDGRVNKREMIKACRGDEEIARFFEVPTTIRQEDGSRSKLEEIFQEIDQDGDREIRWIELLAYYRHRVVDF
mmetsp:Transcript_22611/g.43938  ORF Transcript_22611/g.43938 Transcript_22611/m.43938 type:complete len:465 (-) Transcript_22611:68-1462(-)|eukprot:CAMPEP_0172676096 /NCGR_PEP_ID=MMETSP1074-20121228/13720_1 /TAXON_ID=2916 /ORGANISM="Ceratium fusus, Strain PA161109" /LENGTH=464 /DNA_ID=CAMNT_0013493667 /DNA_START=34 /DNA_END=1428 /DNA_ORIENTATION=-